METAIVSVICIALIVLGGMTMSEGFLTTIDMTSLGLEEMGDRDGDILRTELSPLDGSWQVLTNTLEVSLGNSGQVKLASFANWDVIVQFYDADSNHHVQWLPYTDGELGDNQWRKKGIYIDAANETPEAFDTGILDPGEEMVIEVKLDPLVGQDTTNLVVVSTPNGVPARVSFDGP